MFSSLLHNRILPLTRACVLMRTMVLALCAIPFVSGAATLEDVTKRTGLAVCEETEDMCVLTNDAGRLVFYPGSRRFEFNRRSIWLNSPVTADFKNGLTFEYPDMAKLICPLFAEPISTNTSLRIQLDAGHGGEDGGCISTHDRMREKDLVLDIVIRIGEILEDRGFAVVYSRTNDTFVTLGGRAALAASNKADAFVSIHANFAGNHTARGTETFTLPFANAESTSSEKSVATVARIGNANDLHNTLLGYFIHRRLPGRVGEADRGLRHARFQVLRDTPCPATLVEVGFLSNINDCRDLSSNWYRDRLAMAVADGITEFATHIPIKPQVVANAPDKAKATDKVDASSIVTNALPAVGVSQGMASATNQTCGSVISNGVGTASVTNALSVTNLPSAKSSVTNLIPVATGKVEKVTDEAATAKEKTNAIVVP